MRKWRKILAFALAAALSTGTLTGCLIHKPSRTNDSSPAVPAPDDIWAPYDETVVITTIVEENSGTNFQGDDDYQNNPWYQAYKDRFNIELRNKWVSNDYNTKINLAIADRDLPDVFYVDYSRMVTLQKAGLIMNLRSAGSTLGDILTEGFTKIIIGEQPIDYFDTVVAQWRDAGGDKATAEINETYGH